MKPKDMSENIVEVTLPKSSAGKSNILNGERLGDIGWGKCSSLLRRTNECCGASLSKKFAITF